MSLGNASLSCAMLRGGEVLFEASGKFYMVYQMSEEVARILLPETLGEIVAVLKGESRRQSLKTRVLGSMI